jgi:hypothetical protein
VVFGLLTLGDTRIAPLIESTVFKKLVNLFLGAGLRCQPNEVADGAESGRRSKPKKIRRQVSGSITDVWADIGKFGELRCAGNLASLEKVSDSGDFLAIGFEFRHCFLQPDYKCF